MKDVDDALQMAAELFTHVAPDVAPPTKIREEPLAPPGTVRYEVRTPEGPFRLKITVDPVQASGLLRGSALLPALAAHGIPAPARVAARSRLRGSELTASIETLLGTTSGVVAWTFLGAGGRTALAEEAARSLLLLHRLALDDLPAIAPPQPLPPSHGRPWRDVVASRSERLLERLRGGGLFRATLLDAIRDRHRHDVEQMPADLERRPCHGQFELNALGVQQRVFAGLRDFEGACAGDPWMDVAHFLGSTADPLGNPAKRFFSTYAAAVRPPADLPARVDLYTSLTVLRAIAYLCEQAPPGVRGDMVRMTQDWLDSKPIRLDDREIVS